MNRRSWEDLGNKEKPSWYMDPLVAQQKRAANLEVVREALRGCEGARVLKTDLFEDAFGADETLSGCRDWRWAAIDVSSGTAVAASRRWAEDGLLAMVSDVRSLPFREGTFPAVVSLSTLDHFATRQDYLEALGELHRVLRVGGVLALTLDNPCNWLYPALRTYLNWRGPFAIGYTPKLEEARQDLARLGFTERLEPGWLVHNPRLISTALFIMLRKMLGRRANGAVAACLRGFEKTGAMWGPKRTAIWYSIVAAKT